MFDTSSCFGLEIRIVNLGDGREIGREQEETHMILPATSPVTTVYDR